MRTGRAYTVREIREKLEALGYTVTMFGGTEETLAAFHMYPEQRRITIHEKLFGNDGEVIGEAEG
jgi:hypothetical protein